MLVYKELSLRSSSYNPKGKTGVFPPSPAHIKRFRRNNNVGNPKTPTGRVTTAMIQIWVATTAKPSYYFPLFLQWFGSPLDQTYDWPVMVDLVLVNAKPKADPRVSKGGPSRANSFEDYNREERGYLVRTCQKC